MMGQRFIENLSLVLTFLIRGIHFEWLSTRRSESTWFPLGSEKFEKGRDTLFLSSGSFLLGGILGRAEGHVGILQVQMYKKVAVHFSLPVLNLILQESNSVFYFMHLDLPGLSSFKAEIFFQVRDSAYLQYSFDHWFTWCWVLLL